VESFVRESLDSEILFRERFLKPRREAIGELLDRAMKRGEIDNTLDGEVVLDLVFGPMIYRLMADHGSLNKVEADAMISTLMREIGSRTQETSKPLPIGRRQTRLSKT
jgi:hypothetical protein